jgi:hypothetical protein
LRILGIDRIFDACYGAELHVIFLVAVRLRESGV